MRISYPRSFLSLLLIGFTIVAAPLVFALFANAVAFEKLAALSEQAVLAAVKVTQASRALTAHIASLERAARQYAVAGESPFLEAYRANRAAFGATLRSIDEMALSEAQRAQSGAIAKLEQDWAAAMVKADSSVLESNLAKEWTLTEDGQTRRVSMEVRALAIGAITDRLSALVLGASAQFAGFLAQGRNGRGVVFHITSLD